MIENSLADKAEQGWNSKRFMKILISGASGFIGQRLVKMLTESGHDVARLGRGTTRPIHTQDFVWNIETGTCSLKSLDGFDAVINLVGESVAARRWTSAQKKRLVDSRIQSTALLAKLFKASAIPPKIFLSASAVGVYGNRGDEKLTELSSPGIGFLAVLAQTWEQSATLHDSRIRQVLMRFGVVLDPAGGALSKMLLPFKLGLGGTLGSGRQYFSWISLADACRAIVFCLENQKISGPVNIVAPDAVTNKEFTATLGKELQRPTIFKLPSLVLKIVLGEMAEALLLSSQRVYPEKLIGAGFEFKHAKLVDCIKLKVEE